MKKQLALLASLWLAFGSMTGPALADDPWFNKWDHNHDNHWNYNEFRSAYYNWCRHHHDEKRLSDRELQAEFDRMAASHRTWVAPDDVRTWRHW